MASTGILLEAGTNEIEIMEFLVGDQSFGINALKIREVVQYAPSAVTAFPGANPAILGTLLFHGSSIRVVDLARFLKIDRKDTVENNKRRIVLICEFNNQITGFLIDKVEAIHRVSWRDIQPPSAIIKESKSMITGVALINDRQTVMLDFEMMTDTIFGSRTKTATPTASDEPDAPGSLRDLRSQVRIFAADDTSVVRSRITDLLSRAGYRDFRIFDNGAEAFHAIMALKDKANAEGRTIRDYLNLLITDIEMPQMDGLTLCKNIKEACPDIQVVVLSSMISDQMAHKCKSVSADAFLTKSQFDDLIELVDRISLPHLNQ